MGLFKKQENTTVERRRAERRRVLWGSRIAHLDGAQSELIVPSDHAAPRNAEAIREVQRILKTYP